MLKHLLFLVLAVASTGTPAEVFMCKKPGGETEFSDTPCKAGSSSEVVPDRDPLTQQQKNDAQQQLQQKKQEAQDLASKRAKAEASQQRENEVAKQTAPATPEVIDEGTTYGCYEGASRGINCAGRVNDGAIYKRPLPNRRPLPR